MKKWLFISDDGKYVGTEEQIKAYEAKLDTRCEDDANGVREAINFANDMLEEYLEKLSEAEEALEDYDKALTQAKELYDYYVSRWGKKDL